MNFTQTYHDICRQCGVTSSPELFFAKLGKNNPARHTIQYSHNNSRSRHIITVDLDQIFTCGHDLHQVITHELSHSFCTQVVGGGGINGRGESGHGSAFLAAWLWLLRNYGAEESELSDISQWHAAEYGLTKKQLELAKEASAKHDKILDAIRGAMEFQKTTLKEHAIMLLVGLSLVSYMLYETFLAKGI